MDGSGWRRGAVVAVFCGFIGLFAALYWLLPAREFSPLEKRVLAGLPEPEVNVCFYDDLGQLRRRLDMAYRRHRLALEYDGRQHAEDARQWGRDLDRREWLDARGWRLIVLRAEDVFSGPLLSRASSAHTDCIPLASAVRSGTV